MRVNASGSVSLKSGSGCVKLMRIRIRNLSLKTSPTGWNGPCEQGRGGRDVLAGGEAAAGRLPPPGRLPLRGPVPPAEASPPRGGHSGNACVTGQLRATTIFNICRRKNRAKIIYLHNLGCLKNRAKIIYLHSLGSSSVQSPGFFVRVSDPDPYPDPDWIRIQSDHWIRIRIRNLNTDPDPGGQK
jgi:hypothetical protein